MKFEDDSRLALVSGVQSLTKAVKTTLGPKGRNVVIERNLNEPVITKDGVTVANSIEFEDPYQNIGARIVKEAAQKTNDIAGDGTTTVLVLSEAIMKEGLKVLKNSKRFSPVGIKNGIDQASKDVIKLLKERSIPIENSPEAIKHVASISANNSEKVGELIKAAIESVSADGVIEVETSKNGKTYIDVTDGMQIDNGLMLPSMMNMPKKRKSEYKNPLILVTNYVFSDAEDIYPILQYSVKKSRPFVIFADDLKNAALQTVNQNLLEGNCEGAIIKTPGFNERQIENMQDIAAIVGAKYINRDTVHKIKDIPEEHVPKMFGSADKVSSDRYTTHIIDGKSDEDALEKQIAQVKSDIVDENSSQYDKDMAMKRLGKLEGGVAVINVGADTKFETGELKDRVEDALNSTRSAIKEGILPGGGIAFHRISNMLKPSAKNTADFVIGYEILLDAIKVPIQQIMYNCGLSGYRKRKIFKEIKNNSFNIGYDAKNNVVCDLIDAGIIDPALVSITALKQAASIAGTFLTTECVVAVKPDQINVNSIPTIDLED